jgi:isopenicillin N synthase-like dioxygenase
MKKLERMRECPMQVESWNPCPHIPGCITVNIGDALQAFSDGLLKSNYHRVRMPEPGEPQVRLSLHACMPAAA